MLLNMEMKIENVRIYAFFHEIIGCFLISFIQINTHIINYSVMLPLE